MKRKALGKGLAALLPEQPKPSEDRPGETLLEVEPDRIDPNPNQPRQHIDREKLDELTRSLKEQGVVQPVLVRRQGSRFQLVAGERRWRAAKKAGLAKIPVVVREVDDRQALEIALVENIQREELNPIEEAAAYRRMVSELGYSQQQVAERVGKDRSTVANLLRLLRLPRDVRRLVAEQKLSPGHARPLLSLADAEAQQAIAQAIVDDGLSVREVERRVSKASDGGRGSKKKAASADPNTREAERHLEKMLGTVVRIRRQGKKRGRVEIDFHSEDELQRIYEVLDRGSRAAKRRRS